MASVELAALLDQLGAAGAPERARHGGQRPQGPGAIPPAVWRDARIRTPAGVVTLRRVPSGVAVVVFGNADDALRAAQRTIAETLLALH